jgi:hypothetical protein
MMFPKLGKKKSPAKTLRKKCLKLWSEIIRGRANGLCEVCGKPAKDAHHIIARGTAPSMGWFDVDNGIALCFQCHRVHGAHSLDIDEQIAFREKMIAHLVRKGIDYETLKIRCKAKGGIAHSDYGMLYLALLSDRQKITVRK